MRAIEIEGIYTHGHSFRYFFSEQYMQHLPQRVHFWRGWKGIQ